MVWHFLILIDINIFVFIYMCVIDQSFMSTAITQWIFVCPNTCFLVVTSVAAIASL